LLAALCSLTAAVATASTTARYGNNTEFGVPADADAGDDFIVRRREFAASYNPSRGTPNWVSYNLEATHFGPDASASHIDPASGNAWMRTRGVTERAPRPLEAGP
jgi:hypothetical protein